MCRDYEGARYGYYAETGFNRKGRAGSSLQRFFLTEEACVEDRTSIEDMFIAVTSDCELLKP